MAWRGSTSSPSAVSWSRIAHSSGPRSMSDGHEPQLGVVRPVPSHVAERGEGHGVVAVLHRPGPGPVPAQQSHAAPAVLGPDAHLVEVALPVDDGDHRVAHDLLAEHRHPDGAAFLVTPELGGVVGRCGGDPWRPISAKSRPAAASISWHARSSTSSCGGRTVSAITANAIGRGAACSPLRPSSPCYSVPPLS